MPVDLGFGPGLQADHLAVTGVDRDGAAQGAVGANRVSPLEIPVPSLVTRWFVSKNPSGAEIYDVAGKGALQAAVFLAAEISVPPYLQGSQVVAARMVLIKAAAAPAADAAVHFMSHQGAQVLIMKSSLEAVITPDPLTAGYGHIL